MKSLIALSAAIGISASALAQSAIGTPQPAARVTNSFDLLVHGPYSDIAALFGPQGERAWAGTHWDPHFLFPQPPHDEEGAVFTVQHGPFQTVWVNTLFDVQGRHFQYVYFMADRLVTTIDVRFRQQDRETTQVHVTYMRTALTPEANQQVQSLGESDKSAGAEWQASIDSYLATRKH